MEFTLANRFFILIIASFFVFTSLYAQEESTTANSNTSSYERSPLTFGDTGEEQSKDEPPLGFWESLNRGDLTSSPKPNSEYESSLLSPQETSPLSGGDMWGLAFKMILSLMGIILLILFVVYFMKKFIPNTNPGFRGGMISVAARFYIDPKKVIYVINVGNRQFLVVGSTPEGLNTLAEITDEVLIKDIVEQTEKMEESQSKNKFINIFKKKLNSKE